MKVIHFLNELKFSGAEIMYVDAAPVFRRLGCELTVVNTAADMGEYAPSFREAGYTVLHKPVPVGFMAKWKMRKELIKLIKDGGYDVVHIHRSGLHWIVAYCAWKAGGVKTVYTAHSVFRSHWWSWPLQFLRRWISHNIFHCTLQTISDSVDKNERCYYHGKTALVYNWYGKYRFFPAEEGEKDSVRKELGIAGEALVVVSVGGCSHIKRHHDVIRAMAEIVKKYPDAVYLHLGEGGTLEEEKALASELHLDGNVRFLGNKKDVRRYLIASDIYLMPSKFEGLSITAIEAMACRIPAILYNVPGLCDFNAQGECSMLIPEDSHILAESVISLYEDKEKQEVLKNNAQALVNDKFDMEQNARKIYGLYCE